MSEEMNEVEGHRPRHPDDSQELQACFNCVCWLVEPAGDLVESGACRRLPPVVVSDGVSLQPKTIGSSWCAEWRARG